MWDHSTPIHVIYGNTTTLLACHIACHMHWLKTSTQVQCNSLDVSYTDSWQWYSPVPRKHIGTRTLRFYFSVKELDRMRENGKNSHLDAYFSNDGKFQLSTTCLGLHFCNLTWEWEFKCTWMFRTFLNKICYQVKVMWKSFFPLLSNFMSC